MDIPALAKQAVNETQQSMIMHFDNFESALYQRFADLVIAEVAEERRITENERKLVDIMFQIGIAIQSSPYFADKTTDEVAEWIAGRLHDCGFETTPCGASWGYLTKTPTINK